MNLFGYQFSNFGKELSYRFFAVGYDVQHDGWTWKDNKIYTASIYLGFFQVWFTVISPFIDEG